MTLDRCAVCGILKVSKSLDGLRSLDWEYNMSTIHNPSNFNPQDYEVVGYFDNRPPEYHFGMTAECFRAFQEEYRRERADLFPNQNCYRCEHCGQANVRYVVSCLHIPTGERVCFGDICVGRLGFKNHSEFKATQVRAKAELDHKRVMVYVQYLRWLESNPDAANLVADAALPLHARNGFVQDVVGKLKTYGTISERQKSAVLGSMSRAAERANAPKEIAGEAPTGRVDITGIIISTKLQESDFGISTKMMVKLANNAKVWCSVPSALFTDLDEMGRKAYGPDFAGSYKDLRGCKVDLRATWTRKDGDPSFAFGKRPHGKLLALSEAPAGQKPAPVVAQEQSIGAALNRAIDTLPEDYRPGAREVVFKGLDTGRSLTELYQDLAGSILEKQQQVAAAAAEALPVVPVAFKDRVEAGGSLLALAQKIEANAEVVA